MYGNFGKMLRFFLGALEEILIKSWKNFEWKFRKKIIERFRRVFGEFRVGNKKLEFNLSFGNDALLWYLIFILEKYLSGIVSILEKY